MTRRIIADRQPERDIATWSRGSEEEEEEKKEQEFHYNNLLYHIYLYCWVGIRIPVYYTVSKASAYRFRWVFCE